MTKRSDRRPENLLKPDGASQCRLTREDRACGFHQGQSTRMLTNRPVIVTQSDLLTSRLQRWGSPYSSGFAARCEAQSAARQASAKNRRLEGMLAARALRFAQRHLCPGKHEPEYDEAQDGARKPVVQGIEKRGVTCRRLPHKKNWQIEDHPNDQGQQGTGGRICAERGIAMWTREVVTNPPR
jgi:hypothetical protein